MTRTDANKGFASQEKEWCRWMKEDR